MKSNFHVSFKFISSCAPAWIVFFIVALASNPADATEEVFTGGLKRKELKVTTPVFEVSDNFPSSVEQTLSVRDVIWFTVDEDTIVKNSSFTHWVKLTIEKYDASNTLIGTETNVQFTVSFNPAEGARYAYGQVYEFAGAHRFKVTITSKSASFPDYFRLDGKIIIDRKYAFNCDTVPELLTPSHAQLYDATTNSLRVGWSKMAGAEEYDLEWAFYDTLGATIDLATGTFSDFGFIFHNNATRVTTSHTWYDIPLVYPQGRIYWRLRGVRYKNNQRQQSKWTSVRPAANTLVKRKEWYWVNGHETGLNWQMQTVFAEEGKKSQSATYFDGSLRNRQKVLRSDAINMVVASETIYDSLGRATLQAMPAPVSYGTGANDWTRAIQYIDSYTTAPGKSSYSAADFNFQSDSCSSATWNPAAQMDSTTSALARYFSSANPWKTSFMAKFTPASGGYPFAVSEFMTDPTSRVRRQGGVGPSFQLGSKHETRYFYTKPDQTELDRLFGNEVGEAAHYQKNAVIDPNGQISISYLDAHGRTIASALAGPKPENVEQLPNFSATAYFKKNLLHNLPDDLALRSTYSLFVTDDGVDTFRYSFSPSLQLSIDSCLSAVRCYDCKYDVEISVVDQCGQEMINGGVPFTWNNYSSFDLSCETLPDTLNQMLLASLKQGNTYQVTKTIRLSKTALNYYADDFITHLTCIPDIDSLKRLFLGDTICAVSCDECTERLGNYIDFLSSWVHDIPIPTAQDSTDARQAFQAALESCSELCDNSDPGVCEVMYELMLTDISPGGQYAGYGEDYFGLDSFFIYVASSDTTSVFYKAPADNLYPYQDVDHIGLYYDELGNVDYITLPDSLPIRIDSLSINEFITFFKPSWLKTLVKAHPEYCAWLCCKNSSDHQFDSLLTSTNTYNEALANGFLPIDSLIAHDSFFVFNPDLAGRMDTLWHMYTYTHASQCSSPIDLTDIFKSIVFCGGILPCEVEFDTLCIADNNLYWELIKSHYLSERTRLNSNRIRGGACPAPPDSVSYYCRLYSDLCFGQPTCNGQPNPYRDKTARLFSSPAPLPVQVTEDSMHIMIQYVQDQLENACDTTCTGMADAWIQQLQVSCDSIANATATQLNELRSRFIAVCKSGCDLAHPFGVVETPGDSTIYGDYNLSDAIWHVFPDLDTCSSGCRSELIGFPGTWTTPQYTAPAIQFYTYDTCRCTRLQELYTCRELTDPESASFLEYLNSFSNIHLTEAQLTQLQNGCNSDCVFMDEPIAIPPILECNACKTLTELQAEWTEWGKHECIQDEIEEDEKAMTAGHFNRLFGLNRNFEDYYAFIVSGPQDNPDCRYLCPLAIFPTVDIDTSCVSAELDEGVESLAQLAYNNLLDSMRQVFIRKYLGKCLGPDLNEIFTVGLLQREYHYTLYYYDQADNLVRTVPPKGVLPLSASIDLQAVKNHRADPENPGKPPKYPAHSFNTRYWYNSLNQVIRDSTPDRGYSDYWYDQLGRIILSQNAAQRADIGFPEQSKFSYTKYDALGRIIEAGKLATPFFYASPEVELGHIWNYEDFLDLLEGILSEKFEVTQTFYDDIIPESSPILSSLFPNLGDVAGQQNLRNRISSITFEHYWDKIDTTFDYATHYSYDIAGNVKQLVQDIPELAPVGHRFKRMGYEYDLISGKANYAYYQQDSVDQFIHHYVYDEDNRVEYVETSRDGLLWERDANYEYYLHGPLGRTELGERRVQGLDYAYTLQGWLKGMNASTLSLSSTTSSTLTTRDMGRDGNGGNTGDLTRNKLVGRDVAGYTLGYYYGDYRMVSTTSGDRFEMTYAKNNYIDQSSASLYNGNIRHAMYTIAKLNEKTPYDATVEMYAYKYDQLHRLRSQRAYNSGYSYSSFAWVSGSASTMFQEDVNYDPNGNILSYYRRGNSGTPATVMDNLTYQFGSDNNKLLYIDDAQTNTSAYIGDLEDQSSGNYNYDQNGNLTQDTRDSITAITWTNAQKIDAVAKTDRSIAFKYNPLQQRVAKYSKAIGSDAEKRTYYVRDAQGNVMATYQAWVQNDNGDISWDSFALLEHHIYGTARVGMALPNVKLYPAAPPNPHAADSMHYEIFEGWKRYEIANHLGNVLAVVTDRKRGKASSGQNIQWFVADVVASQQYYPFGMLMPGDASVTLRRQYSLNSTDYRYGFNGKEGDDEIKGDDNQQDYGMRIYDPRVARFLSVDPITAQYPMLTPYQFASNTPIQAIDLDGLEAWQVNNTWNGYYINLFRNEVVSQISNSKSLRKKYTCDDLGLELIVEFSKNHNLPFKWSTGVMEFDAESPEFKDYESFLLSLKMKSGAPDFDNLRNTADIAKDNIQIGSLSVLTHTGKDRPNHIQLISGITISENGSVDNYSVAQGNFRSDFWGGRLQGSNSPKDFNYLGVEIEEGYYITDIDTWYNNSKNTITENFSKEYKIQYKNYNFELWNKKFLYQQKYKVDTGPSGTMGGGLYWVREGETHRENRNDKEK